jgi:signal transduction histidine kinase
VEDDGPGVPAAVSSALFQPFVTSKSEGTGLGLPICRRIVEEHGGTIEVWPGALSQDALGGARFHIRLPLQRPSDAAPERAPA